KMRNKPAWIFPLLLALMSLPLLLGTTISVSAQHASLAVPVTDGGPFQGAPQSGPGGPIAVPDYKHDVSPPLRDIPPARIPPRPDREKNPPRSISTGHVDAPDPVVQNALAPLAMPSTILNFNGIPFPGVACNCAPPDTNGEVGATQYVQIVNE